MRAVGAKVAVGVIVADMVDVYFPAHLHGNGYWHYPPGLMLRYFYRKQAAPRPIEQVHGARLALLLRLQRDNSLMVVYLGRCPRLYTAALSARIAHAGLAHGCHGSHSRHLSLAVGCAYSAHSPRGFAPGSHGVAHGVMVIVLRHLPWLERGTCIARSSLGFAHGFC